MLFKMLGVKVGVEGVNFMSTNCVCVDFLKIGDVLVNYLVIEPLFGLKGAEIMVIYVSSILVFYFYFVIRKRNSLRLCV